MSDFIWTGCGPRGEALASAIGNDQELNFVRAPSSFPRLGDPGKTYSVSLTEPEINTIGAVFGYCHGQILGLRGLPPNDFTRSVLAWWEHYGPTLLALNQRLEQFDDGNAPRAETPVQRETENAS